MKQLYDTVFVQTLSAQIARVLRDTVDPSTHELTRPLTPAEQYLRSCLVVAGEVVAACDQLHYSLAYLSGYRARHTSAGELITRADYIAYQLENLHLRLSAVPDRSLWLTSTVFRLGLPARECNMRTVADNAHVRATPARVHLRKVDKVVGPYREVRNMVAHRERYSDPELARIEGYFILEKSDQAPPDPTIDRFRHFYKCEADHYVLAARQEFEPVVSATVSAVRDLFNGLLPVFEVNHDALLQGRLTSGST